MKTSYTKVSSDKLQVTDFKSKRSAYLSTSQGGDRACLLDEQVHAAYSPVPQVVVSEFKVSYFNQAIRHIFNFPFLFIACILLNLVQGQTESNVSKVGTTAAPFLEIEVGARALGMGGAFVAVANDATAIYWNPAGISHLSKIEATLIHTNWLVGTNFDFVGVVIPMGHLGSIAVNVISFSTDEMEVRTVQNPEGTGEKFSYGDLSAGLSYAKNLTDKFSIGVNAKYISQRIWHMKAKGYALDIGTLFRTRFNGMMIGMSISNFGPSMKMEGRDVFVNHDEAPQFGGSNDQIPAFKLTDKFPLPLLFRVGVAMDILKSNRNQLTIAVDAAHPNNNTEYINLGMEYIFRNQVSLRVGYKNLFTLDTEEGFTAGVGTKLKLAGGVALKIDYAYQDFGRLQNAQQFSLGFEF